MLPHLLSRRAVQFLLPLLLMAIALGPPLRAGEAEPELLMDLRQETLARFREGDFSSLEKVAARYRDDKERTAAGAWRLSMFYAALDGLRPTERGDGDLAGTRFRGWIDAHPSSPTPYIAASRAMLKTALMGRSQGGAAQPDAASAKATRQGLQRVAEFLDRHKQIAARDPEWYVVRLELLAAQKEPASAAGPVLAEGQRTHGYYHPLAYAGLLVHLTTVPADTAAIDKAARAAMERTHASDGAALYARMYWYARSMWFAERLFADSKIDWTLMKTGIRDLVERHPDDWNINSMAAIACLQGDRREGKRLMALAKGEPHPMAWPDMRALDRCGILPPSAEEVKTPLPQAVATAAAVDERTERDAIAAMAIDQFERRNFAALTTMTRRFVETRARTPSGGWKSTIVHYAIGRAKFDRLSFEPGGVIPAPFDTWIKQFPDAPGPYIALARAIYNHSQTFRAWGNVPRQERRKSKAWAPYFRALDAAKQLLIDNKKVASRDPEWFALMLRIAAVEAASPAALAPLFEEAVAREPLYYETYFSMARASLWADEEKRRAEYLEQVARAALERTRQAEGGSLYARVYWFAYQQRPHPGFLRATRADRNLLKAGFDDIVQRYPTQWNINYAALFACLGGDDAATKRLFDWMVNGASPAAWGRLSMIADCERKGRPPASAFLPESGIRMPPIESGDDLREAEALDEVAPRMMNGDFAWLEQRAEKFRKGGELTPTGTWKLGIFYSKFRTMATPDLTVEGSAVGKQFKVWRKAYPNSPTPIIAEARFRHQHAFHVVASERGTKDIRKRQIAEQTLKQAASELAATEAIAARDPEWYVVGIDLLTVLRASPDDIAVMLTSVLERHPTYGGAYASAALYLQVAEMLGDSRLNDRAMDLLQRVLDKSPERRAVLMRHLVLALVDHADWWEIQGLRDEWAGIRSELAASIGRYPSDWAQNKAALLACVMEDREETRRRLDAAQNNIMPSVWLSRALVEHCRRFADGAERSPAPQADRRGSIANP